MRTLTSTLLAAQQQPSAVPYVKVEASNVSGGVARLDWERLYEGIEDDYFHAVTMPYDGSLIRVRITPPADSFKLYRQRVTNPDPESDYDQWTYTGQYNAVVVAAASNGAEVSIFWIKSNREIRRIVSTDNGATWGSPELIDYSPSTAIYGLAAAYKPNGDLALFFADQSVLYVKKLVGGQWQAKTAWNQGTGNLSGAATVYDGDWNLLVTGLDTSGNYKLWSLVYGDGGEVTAGTWTDIIELGAAPSGGDFAFKQAFLDNPDVFRCSYAELYTGDIACQRPFLSHTVPGALYTDALWREPVPFNASCEYGLAMTHDDTYAWLSHPAGVWRALLAVQTLGLTDDVTGVRQVTEEDNGSLTVELRNDDGRYAQPGEDGLAVLVPGCRIAVSPGCVTTAGNEFSAGPGYRLEGYEHVSAGGKARLVLHCRDAWTCLTEWTARHQFRWNKTSDEMSVRDIIAVVLARAGLALDTVSESEAVTGLYPDFTINPGADGRAILRRLLRNVPDVLFCEDETFYLVNPDPDDTADYSYGNGHSIIEGRYMSAAFPANRIQVEGYDAGDRIIADSFHWEDVNRFPDRTEHIEDRNIASGQDAAQVGASRLRKAEIRAKSGAIVIPVNCGQQPYDVVDITDAAAGLGSESRRVLGITFTWDPHRANYRQRLVLGAV
ncbi:MAG: hypothetical protein MUO19_08705 [Dehalococcoidales bacterium]|nr:hypothetical protein [Dehalococcoidales bacterium]